MTTGAEETNSWARARANSLILSEMKNYNPVLENLNGGITKTFRISSFNRHMFRHIVHSENFHPLLENGEMGKTPELFEFLFLAFGKK